MSERNERTETAQVDLGEQPEADGRGVAAARERSATTPGVAAGRRAVEQHEAEEHDVDGSDRLAHDPAAWANREGSVRDDGPADVDEPPQGAVDASPG